MPDVKSSPKSPLTKSSAVPPLPTPTYPEGGLFTILATTEISAPAAAVLEAILDLSSWPQWNSFIPRSEIIGADPAEAPQKIKAGTKITFHICMKPAGQTSTSFGDHEVVSVSPISREGKEGWAITWKTINVPLGSAALKAERVQELLERREEAGAVVTEYRSWGTFGGPLAYPMAWTGTKAVLVERFADWANDLKAFVEGKEAEKGMVEDELDLNRS